MSENYIKTIGAHQFMVTPDPDDDCKYYFVQAFVCYFILDTETFETLGYHKRFVSTKVDSDWDAENRKWKHDSMKQGNHFVRVFLDDDKDRVPLVSE